MPLTCLQSAVKEAQEPAQYGQDELEQGGMKKLSGEEESAFAEDEVILERDEDCQGPAVQLAALDPTVSIPYSNCALSRYIAV